MSRIHLAPITRPHYKHSPNNKVLLPSFNNKSTLSQGKRKLLSPEKYSPSIDAKKFSCQMINCLVWYKLNDKGWRTFTGQKKKKESSLSMENICFHFVEINFINISLSQIFYDKCLVESATVFIHFALMSHDMLNIAVLVLFFTVPNRYSSNLFNLICKMVSAHFRMNHD